MVHQLLRRLQCRVRDGGDQIRRPARGDDRPVEQLDVLHRDVALALGWTLKMTALPAEIIAIELLMIVDVGFVVGVIDPMTPYGAHSVTIMPSVARSRPEARGPRARAS